MAISPENFYFITKMMEILTVRKLSICSIILFPFIYRELCSLLQHRNVPIFLISGGFDCIIEPVASLLNIPKENIHANRLKFYFHGKPTTETITFVVY